jgi:hypothetical protein
MRQTLSLVVEHPWILPCLFMIGLLLTGIATFDDYGVSWDEPVQRQYGEKVFNHITTGDRELFADRHRYYGPVFELLLYSLEEAFGLEDTRPIYLMRHLITFLVFWTGALFFFLLCRRVFRDWRVALVGTCFLVASPRIFAHAFYNSKDIPFMAVFIIGVYTLVRLLETRTPLRVALHGVVCALLVDIRIVGVLLPALTLAFVGYEAARSKPKGVHAKRTALSVGLYVIVFLCLTVLLWPTLWRHPLHNFIRVFEGMRNFPWKAPVLYLGSEVWSTELPWHYIPVWIAISTPIALIGLFVVGLAYSGWSLFRRSGKDIVLKRDMVLLLVWFLVPVVYSVLSRAVLYDAWRHAFFVYPVFVMIAVVGGVSIWRTISIKSTDTLRRVLTAAFVLVITVNLGFAVTFMVRHHPHQNVYFNSLTGGIAGAEGRFELDYWGLSYRRGLEHILRNDDGERVIVNAATAPGRYNADILKPGDRKRLVFVTEAYKAEYYLTNFRWKRGRALPGREYYFVKVDDVAIMAVRKMRR